MSRHSFRPVPTVCALLAAIVSLPTGTWSQTVNQVSGRSQPNQWTNSLQSPTSDQSTLWTSDNQFSDMDAIESHIQNGGWSIVHVENDPPSFQVVNPYVADENRTSSSIVEKAAEEFRTAARQLNPFTPRESSRPRPVHQPLPVGQFAAAAATPQFSPQFPIAASVAPTQHQTSPVTLPLAATPIHSVVGQRGFTEPPVIGTQLNVAQDNGLSTLPVPVEAIHEPAAGLYTDDAFDLPPTATPEQVRESVPQPWHRNLPQYPQFPSNTNQNLLPQSAPNAIALQNDVINGPYQNSLAVQQYCPDEFTRQIAQRDLNAFIASSVNGYCNPCQSPTSTPCGHPNCGSVCGYRSGNTSRLWTQFETLIYWMGGYDVPPLATSSPNGTAPADVGVLGIPSTSTLFGDNAIDDGVRTGGRLNMGFWLDNVRRLGAQGEFFALGSGKGDDFASIFGSNQIIARPYWNTATNTPDAAITNMPGLADGLLEIDTSSRVYSGAALMRLNLVCKQNTVSPLKRGGETSRTRIDMLAGYRYFHLGETLRMYEAFAVAADPGASYEFFDEYRTKNDFHGAEFGFNWLRQRNRHYLELQGSVALGEVTRTVDVNGFSRVVIPGVLVDEFASGFYTNPSQQGETVDRAFAVLPQLRGKVGYCITPNLRAFVGYDFLYLSSVVRPGTQINQHLDPNDLLTDQPSSRRLQRYLIDDEAWMQGASFGLQYNF